MAIELPKQLVALAISREIVEQGGNWVSITYYLFISGPKKGLESYMSDRVLLFCQSQKYIVQMVERFIKNSNQIEPWGID